ncbi:aldo/keto reductase [Actinomyces viscosus]|uniref:Uncharacterized oxidoreductase MSMEG_2408 n=1 Tax=Actinomyces viscosus TaxID=1656 RepID=A0A448PKT2_ACTVI|nr:aldo/keto reductase [Actinomyces viscosus]TFH52124.1 aldo/keto reductase [Actinomyces viscosus]VEI15981.1 Uncharacterized oxidoreductase MSMEG_2408 [Actinomyces viscosus]
MKHITLNNGTRIPVLGLGVYQTPESETEHHVREAIEVGYRLIDTAQYYRNEEGVGRAVRGAVSDGVAREDLFVTTKLAVSGHRAGKRAIEQSLAALGLDYIDLMLIHWPQGNDLSTWRALEDACAAGLLKSIGLSNFYGDEVQEIVRATDIPPVVDQVETHAYLQQRRLQKTLAPYDIRIEAWSPLRAGRSELLREPVLERVAEAHDATPAQVALAFQVATGVITIPKTVHRERMVENLAAADLELSAQELAEVAALDRGRSSSGWPNHPEQSYDPAEFPFTGPLS